MLSFNKKERSLGIAKEPRQYDLPLNKGNGQNFLIILMGLMTILALFALSASFALSEVTNRWSSGLENRATIEIPAEDINGQILRQDEITKTAEDIMLFLTNNNEVKTAEIMQEDTIKELVAPWLGDNITFEDVPLPGIISVHFHSNDKMNLQAFENRLKNFGEHVRLDTHSQWLANLLKVTGALNFSALFMSLLIGITTVTAVAGAVQSRMSVFHDELELLHLMGADDDYIAKQLQRHTFFTCLKGAVIGTVIGLIMLIIIGLILNQKDISLIPDFDFSLMQMMTLLVLPLFISILAMFTARQTVLRVLTKMP